LFGVAKSRDRFCPVIVGSSVGWRDRVERCT
jgi:hypothetical protein